MLFTFRKKLKSTSRYIYQTLFVNGENSDIRICALGQVWNLHKVYLCQVQWRCETGPKGSYSETNVTIIFLSFFCSRAISPACSVDRGKSPTWWKSTWRSQTRTSTPKVSGGLNSGFSCCCCWWTIFVVHVYLQLCRSFLGPSTGTMFWSSPAGLSVFSPLLVCYSWSVWLKVLPACKCCVAFCCQSHGLLLSTGWTDPAVWRDDEGKHQQQERVWLLCLCQHLWAGLSDEEVRLKSR